MSDEPKVDRVAETRNPYGEQDEWGNSIGSLRANLRLTPAERLRKAEGFAKAIEELRRKIKPIPRVS